MSMGFDIVFTQLEYWLRRKKPKKSVWSYVSGEEEKIFVITTLRVMFSALVIKCLRCSFVYLLFR